MHYVNKDKRLDEWILESSVRPAEEQVATPASINSTPTSNARKRKRNPLERELLGVRADATLNESNPFIKSGEVEDEPERDSPAIMVTEEEYDIEHHKQITAKRNFDKVNFGKWQIKTWWVSRSRSQC